MFQTVAIVLSLGLTAVTVIITTMAVRQMLGVLRQGQPTLGRTDQPAKRTITMLKETFGHTRMLQWTWVGIMHWFVYGAFIVLSTAVATAYVQLFDPEFVLPIIGHWYPLEWTLEFLGLLSTIGIIFLIIYRQKHHPRSVGRQSRFFGSTMWQAYFVEAFALLEGGAILFIRAAEYKLIELHGAEHGGRGHFPLSSFLGDAIYPDGEHALENVIYGVAVFKIVLAMVWLIVISRNLTMGIAWHRFTAWPNIWFKRESSGRTALGAVKPLISDGKAIGLDDIDDLDEDSALGVGSIEDFSWKGILDFTTCTECGRCQSQCPAWNTEKPLSPKLLITSLRDHAYAKAAGDEAAQERVLVGASGKGTDTDAVDNIDWFYNPEDAAFVIDEDVLWNCTSCGACVQQCPVDIEHVDHIIDMRRYAVLVESNFPSELNGLFKGLENKGNPWNMSPTARLDWTKGLDFEVKVVGDTIESLDEVEWLFWVGCAGAYEDRAKKTTRAVAELLDMAGVTFGVLGNGETCTGDPARRAGNEFVFQGLAQQNVEVLTEAKAKKVVSTCAHCFNTLKNEYSQFGVELEVVHHTQLLNRLVREGKLTPVKDGAGAHKRSITYHDPCYIGRHNGVYTPPRELLQILPGATYVEMERNSERSFCCGAGGARMWMEENIGSRINVNRTTEAIETGADQIAVGCPFCRVMLSDGLTMKQSKDEAREEVEILDIAQMLLASVKGEMATKYAPGGAPKEDEAPVAKKNVDKDVATKAEPEAGDETITDDTVVQTQDAGPLAKASGGTSLFDDPEVKDEPAETAAKDKAPAEEAKAAKPASSGGSLFDLGGDGDQPEAKAEQKPATQEKARPSSKAEPASDLGSGGGSLFDLGGDQADEPETKSEPTATEEPAPAAKTETKPKADLTSGGSLFDIGPDESAAPRTEEKPPSEAATKATDDPAPEPQSKDAGQSKPVVDLTAGGSLFDIASPEPGPAPKTVEPEVEVEVEEAKPEVEEARPEAEPATKAAPAASVTPAAIPDGGSLFDIQAPEPVATTPKETEPEAKADVKAEATVLEPQDDVEPATTQTETKAPAPAAKPPSVAATTPGTEIPEGGSLFEIQAPDPVAVEPAAAKPEAAETRVEPEARTKSKPKDEPEPEPEPTVEDQPKLEGTPGTLSGGAAVSAAATAVASDEPGPADDSPDPAAESEAKDEPEAASEQKDEPEAAAEDQVDPEPEATNEPRPTDNGQAHQPRTDVEIGEGSLFDL